MELFFRFCKDPAFPFLFSNFLLRLQPCSFGNQSLTRPGFERFALGFAQRPHVALYARDARSPRDADDSGFATVAIDEWQRTSYLAPLI